MTYVIYRTDRSGEKTVVACVDDQGEIGQVIDEDRQKYDREADYKVVQE